MKGSALGEQTLTNSDKATKAFIVGAKCDTNTMCSATLRLTESWSKSEFYARLDYSPLRCKQEFHQVRA
jgi:hypothetical protein